MRKPTILVADDDRCIRSALRKRLTANGYHVLESPDGLGVIAQYLKEPVDAIILDHEMPNGDGRSVAHLIRKESDVPIVFVSGHSREEFRRIVMRLPDVYFLPKPFDAAKLLDLLASVIQTPRRLGDPARKNTQGCFC